LKSQYLESADLQKQQWGAKQGSKTTEDFAFEIQNITQRITLLECTRNAVVQADAQATVETVYMSQGLTAFQNGLEGELKLAVMASRSDNLEQALQVAISVQNMEEEFSSSLKKPSRRFYVSQNILPTSFEIDQIQNIIDIGN
jgi:hypothetical protein